MPPEGDKADVSLSQQFATAFSEEDGGAAPKGDPLPPDPKPGDEGDKGGDGDKDDDPLKGVTLAQLQQHPELGKQLNSWADSIANKRIAAEVETAQARGKSEGRQEVTAESRDRFFADLSKDREELAKELAADDDLAVEYADWQKARRSAAGDTEAVSRAAQVYALSTQITTISQSLADAKLPPEVLADPKLKPETYIAQGATGVVAWGKAATEAITAHKAQEGRTALTDEAREALRQEIQAELDAKKPGGLGASGRRDGARPDLIKTPARLLARDAWA